jgi:integrase
VATAPGLALVPAQRGAPDTFRTWLALVDSWTLSRASAATAATYGAAWSRVDAALRAAGRVDLALNPLRIGPAEAALVVAALRRRYRPATVNLTLSALRGLWRRAADAGLPVGDPWHAVGAERPPVAVAEKVLPREAIPRLFAAARTPYEHLLLRLLYHAGLRVSEACALDWGHVRQDGDAWRATIYGKGGKTRWVPLLPELVGEALELDAPGRDGDPFAPADSRGTRWDRFRAHAVVKAVARRAGLGDAPSPHWLRHCCAAHLAAAGVPLNEVQALLGHASLATTGIYLRIQPTAASVQALAFGPADDVVDGGEARRVATRRASGVRWGWGLCPRPRRPPRSRRCWRRSPVGRSPARRRWASPRPRPTPCRPSPPAWPRAAGRSPARRR